jgi:putative phosphoesterase
MLEAYIPQNLSRDEIALCIGLISDTHAPERWPDIPPAVFEVLKGVDLLLHAGDVGELWVLDRLSVIAAVIAVHGNDETAEATRELPYQQLITVGGQRLLLCHSHFPDRAEELASREGDDWTPRLAHYASQARSAGAQLYVFGHLHIPFFECYEGVWLVNPGAIASGNPLMRQLVQTVALLFLRNDGRPFVTHVDLANPERPYQATVEWPAGFNAAYTRYHASILTPEMQAIVPKMVKLGFVENRPLRQAYMRLAHRCWAGELPVIGMKEFLAGLEADPDVPAADKARVLSAFQADSL